MEKKLYDEIQVSEIEAGDLIRYREPGCAVRNRVVAGTYRGKKHSGIRVLPLWFMIEGKRQVLPGNGGAWIDPEWVDQALRPLRGAPAKRYYRETPKLWRNMPNFSPPKAAKN